MSSLHIIHGCRTLQLTRGLNTLIDESDFSLVGHYAWHARPHHSMKTYYYAIRQVTVGVKKQFGLRLHRWLMNADTSHDVDHRNGDTLDNRRSNLRLASPRQNTQNTRRVVGESRFKGVSRAGKNWRARIRLDGSLIQLGCHRTQEQAARAYDAAAVKYFGEFACTNHDLLGDY